MGAVNCNDRILPEGNNGLAPAEGNDKTLPEGIEELAYLSRSIEIGERAIDTGETIRITPEMSYQEVVSSRSLSHSGEELFSPQVVGEGRADQVPPQGEGNYQDGPVGRGLSQGGVS